MFCKKLYTDSIFIENKNKKFSQNKMNNLKNGYNCQI